MATPSSSNTTPSPPLSARDSVQPPSSLPLTTEDRERRNRSVGKFMARAEISMVTRALRARLAYASYKATHNVPHASLQELEEQLQTQANLAARATNNKRKAATASYYNSQLTQPAPIAQPALTGAPTTRPQLPFINLTVDVPMDIDEPQRPSSRNLFTTLLSSPASRPRTVHNADDPLPKAAVRPEPSSRSRGRNTPVRSIAEGTRAQAKTRREEKVANAAKRSNKSRKTRPSKNNKDSDTEKPDADGDVDMKAVAALTSLLYQSRPSPMSPRSSTGSDSGTQPASQLVTSASHTTATPPSSHQSITPPPTIVPPATSPSAHGAPDKEAADLMLFLATSPSPVRQSTAQEREAKDAAAFHTLRGTVGGTKDKGRLLFSEGAEPSSSPPAALPKPLTRSEVGDSFASVSSIGSDMRGRSPAAVPTLPPSQTLPPLPSLHPPLSPLSRGSTTGKRATQPQNAFNLNEIMNVSPSSRLAAGGSPTKGGLRADVGRKLFEEEQLRQQSIQSGAYPPQPDVQGLSAGIDLVHT